MHPSRATDELCLPDRDPPAIRGLDLRYLLTTLLLESGHPVALGELVERVRLDGFVLAGRPSKVVSDALRWDVRRGRVVRLGRGVYRAGIVPRQTKSRILHRVRDMREHVRLVDDVPVDVPAVAVSVVRPAA